VPHFFAVLVIYPSVPHFFAVLVIYPSVAHFFKRDTVFQVWRIILSVPHFSECGAFLQVCCTFPSFCAFFQM